MIIPNRSRSKKCCQIFCAKKSFPRNCFCLQDTFKVNSRKVLSPKWRSSQTTFLKVSSRRYRVYQRFNQAPLEYRVCLGFRQALHELTVWCYALANFLLLPQLATASKYTSCYKSSQKSLKNIYIYFFLPRFCLCP